MSPSQVRWSNLDIIFSLTEEDSKQSNLTFELTRDSSLYRSLMLNYSPRLLSSLVYNVFIFNCFFNSPLHYVVILCTTFVFSSGDGLCIL